MNLNDFKSSKFLKKEDVGDGVLVTIDRLTQENVAKEGAEPEWKIAVYFKELEKPLICNSTNAQIIAQITGHDMEVDQHWPGTQVVLYTDPNISFGGKLVGGIRVRAPKFKKPESEPEMPF